MSAAVVPSKVRNIVCVACAGTGHRGTIQSGPCYSCSGYGMVSEHALAECWCDGTAAASEHDNH